MPNPWDETWTIGESLGKNSGQGLTYFANRKSDDTAGVLKKLRNNRSLTSRARMHREAANLKLLNTVSAAVPTLLDDNTSQHSDGKTQLFLVTEFIEGPTVAEHITENGLLTLDDASILVSHIGTTLRAGHAEDILHRDLKPDNLIIRNSELSDPVIIDYGLSFNALDEDITETEETFRNKFLDLPETNTPGGDRRDFRSDITALAAILYFALTAHRIGHLTDSQNRLPHRRDGFAVRDKLADDPRLPQLEAFFDRAFQPSIDERFQSLDEFESRLKSVCDATPQDSRDLKSLAERAYAQLRASDRKLQLAEMKRLVQPAASSLGQLLADIGREIQPLSISSDSAPLRAVPSPYECALTKIILWKLKSPVSELSRIHFAIVAQGSQCVLLFQELTDPKREVAENGWIELIWFSPDSTDIKDQLESSCRGAVASVLSRITDAT